MPHFGGTGCQLPGASVSELEGGPLPPYWSTPGGVGGGVGDMQAPVGHTSTGGPARVNTAVFTKRAGVLTNAKNT